ncbi:MAG TPA: TonB-dependent receptor, partial [bacterium]|nr:TonB-dependent receptor [bacterium]
MKQSIRVLLALCFIFVLVSGSFAQTGKITGHVIDSATKQELVGANVQVVGTSLGAVSDMRGNYTIVGVPSGDQKLKVSFVGYEAAERALLVTAGRTATVNFSMAPTMIMTKGISIFADRAKERETPVAFTNIQKQEMAQRLGSREIPMVLTTTPSVYATTSGGGAGDARVNIRGFDQRNVAIMINGVPINDMENGWVYWSNWDGVSDATSSIQVQRGLSAVNLATPSIGGTMNIITDPSVQKAGITARQEYGTGNFLKSTISVASGQINDKFSVNSTVVVKQGKGIVDKTYTNAWAYYLGMAYNINANNRLELYALGAPQRHGQHTNKQNVGVFNKEFALGLDGYDPAAAEKYAESSS